jgi:hypothetical protein
MQRQPSPPGTSRTEDDELLENFGDADSDLHEKEVHAGIFRQGASAGDPAKVRKMHSPASQNKLSQVGGYRMQKLIQQQNLLQTEMAVGLAEEVKVE